MTAATPIADRLNHTGYRAAVAHGDAQEVGAPRRRQHIMLVATRRAGATLARGLEQPDTTNRKELP